MTRATLACLIAVLAPATAIGQQDSTRRGDILQTILLPRAAEILRDCGVPTADVEEAVIGARRQGLPPAETAAILEDAATSVEENGPIDNFGAFVQQQLDRGLRGRELSAAIRDEHARRGIGKGRKLPGRGKEERGRVQDRESGSDASTRPDTVETGRRRPSGTAGRRPPDSTATSGRRPTAPHGDTHES